MVTVTIMVIAVMRSAQLQRFQSALMSRMGIASSPLAGMTVLSAAGARTRRAVEEWGAVARAALIRAPTSTVLPVAHSSAASGIGDIATLHRWGWGQRMSVNLQNQVARVNIRFDRLCTLSSHS